MSHEITPLNHLIHAVKLKCAAVRDSADLLESVPADEQRELLELMQGSAEETVAILKAFRAQKEPKR